MSIYDLEGYTIDELSLIEQYGIEVFSNYKESYSAGWENSPRFEEWPKTRKEAKNTLHKYYKPDKLCKNGHDSIYSVSVGCLECKRDRYKNRTDEQKQRDLEFDRKRAKTRYKTEKYRTDSRKRREKNREKINYQAREYYHNKLKHDPFFRLSNNIGRRIYQSLKDKKAGKSWKSMFSYTFKELCEHLEKQFTPEMNWDNYGSYWHLDHIKPVSLCNENLDEAWALENLQPLTVFDNLSKNNRYIGHPNNPQWVDKKDKE